MRLNVAQWDRVRAVRRDIRLSDARPNDGRCGNVSAAIEAEFGWRQECGYLRLLDGSISWVHCWNRLEDGSVLDATSDQFGDLWTGDVTLLRAESDLNRHYLPDPREWLLTLGGSLASRAILVCRSAGESRHLESADPQHPWPSLAGQVLQLATGWLLDERSVSIAARALRARFTVADEASTANAIRPLVTDSIQQVGRRRVEPWIACEFTEGL